MHIYSVHWQYIFVYIWKSHTLIEIERNNTGWYCKPRDCKSKMSDCGAKIYSKKWFYYSTQCMVGCVNVIIHILETDCPAILYYYAFMPHGSAVTYDGIYHNKKNSNV